MNVAKTQSTILIVDDEPTNLMVMNRMLSDDYRVLAVKSGEGALQIVAAPPPPDLILLDVMMPEMDGYQVLARLKDNPISANIPVIFVTSMEGQEDEEKGLQLGAVDYVTKPIKPAILLARVRTHLTLKNARDFLSDKNTYLESEVTRRISENQTIQDVSIRALAHLAETRDPETGDHILRTQSYVRVLAEKLRTHPRFRDTINDRYIELITKSAPLHDIGKVGIPDRILLKPGKLDPSEWTIMMTHAALGAEAIDHAEKDVKMSVDFLKLAKEIAHWHHERWDGRGYPDGLSGEGIPVSARIMAIADVFDAIISPRVYKPAMPFEEARDIIQGENGCRFDPAATDAFLDSFDTFVDIATKYRDTP